jgi:hypothetical protein
MEGPFHAPFNAALLHAVALAWPGAEVSFRAFPSHIEAVKEILQRDDAAVAARIEWKAARLPSSGSLPARWRNSGKALREILHESERVLFCSISRMQLLQLKRMMRGSKTQVRAVLHGDLEQIEHPPAERFPRNLFALERVLLRPHPPTLRYLLLGQSIADNLPPRFRAAMGDIGVIEHPYHFPEMMGAPAGPAVFGVFGNSGEGHLLERVAREVKALDPSIRFRLIGFLSGPEAVARLAPLVEGATDRPISRAEFIERAKGITHALWLAPPDSSRLRASGTFFDALAYGKPIIYTANAYMDSYYASEPEIGLRCATMEDVPAAILETSRSCSSTKYSQSQAAMERLRYRFSPSSIAATLPSTLKWNVKAV